MKIKRDASERVLLIFSAVFMSIFTILCIYPFYYVIIGSITSASHTGYVFLYPKEITFATYKQLLSKSTIYMAFFISVSRTALGTALQVLFTGMLAYLMTKQDMPFRKFVYRYFIITMYVSGGLIPWFITMKAYGFQNNYLVYVIPSIVSAWNMILIKTFIESLPGSLEESAEIDGAGFMAVFMRIIMPLSKPILATVAVYTSVYLWNTWQDNYFLVQTPNLTTLQLLLYNYLQQADALARTMQNSMGYNPYAKIPFSSATVRMSMVVITVLPIMLVYPFMQRYFTKGIMLGAVKG